MYKKRISIIKESFDAYLNDMNINLYASCFHKYMGEDICFYNFPKELLNDILEKKVTKYIKNESNLYGYANMYTHRYIDTFDDVAWCIENGHAFVYYYPLLNMPKLHKDIIYIMINDPDFDNNFIFYS